MTYITGILTALVALKVAPIVNAIRWLTRHGENHANEIRDIRQQIGDDIPEECFFTSFEKHTGAFFPFDFAWAIRAEPGP